MTVRLKGDVAVRDLVDRTPESGCYAGAMDVVGFLEKNWAVIAQAPWAFVLLAVICLSIGFAAARYRVGEREANLRSIIEAKDTKIAALEDEVGKPGLRKEREALIQYLAAMYRQQTPDAPPRVIAGLDLPPAEWINAELARLKERWRVELSSRDVKFLTFDQG